MKTLNSSDSCYGSGWRRYKVTIKGIQFFLKADSDSDVKECIDDFDYWDDLGNDHPELDPKDFRFEKYELEEVE